jgi:hypothetical protein
MTNGEFFHVLELLGYETVEDCPIGEERIENVAKRISELEAQFRTANEKLKLEESEHMLACQVAEHALATVAQQAATIGELREALEKIARTLRGDGLAVSYESSAGLAFTEAALAKLPKENPNV